MASVSRSALSTARSATRTSLASTSRLVAVRSYASPSTARNDEQGQMMFGGPPPARKDEGAVLKRYTGKGYPFIPSLRHVVYPFHPHLHKGGPLRELTIPLRRKGGRNNTGRVVNRHVGGGHKRRLRTVDFHRVEGGEHDVVRIEYDPGRSAHIALIKKRGTKSEPGLVALSPDEAEDALDEENRGTQKSLEAVKAGWSYIVAPEGLRAGDVVVSYRKGIPESLIQQFDQTTALSGNSSATKASSSKVGATDTPEMRRALGLLRTVTLKPGNVLPLFLIPPGTQVHNLTMTTDGKMQLCRSAGTFAQIVSHQSADGRAIGGADVLTMGGGFDAEGNRLPKNGYVLIKLQSGEVRKLDPGCSATIGVVSNKEHQSRSLGKAGRSRWLGKRPHVRGVAMNAVDHAHGGGRGKQKGNKHPRSIYGLLQHVRTRRPKDKDGNKSVVTERPRGKQTAAKH
ncbi:50S small subunit ribosomal protein L2 [Kwoniella heveanensis CBS 569]|uniref:50S small subunit ribosomal protein L2 n=1 Tax=Kwoniella heveanensis BCC8398 TaxID=1296120 RepID=A0A1B9GTI7_9TREE|nr:50S small subunit ribosomal protein L2 [Kwoniella heveanensis BCC8398]OCF41999.1 50S small subunit ribosomal protein L2 [Kwoniella heveanensis CBS 569]